MAGARGHGDRKGRHYYIRASRPLRSIVREAIAALLTAPQAVGRRRFAHAGGMLAMRPLRSPCRAWLVRPLEEQTEEPSKSRMHRACLKALPGYSQVAGQSDERQSPGVEAPGKPRRRAGRKSAPHCTLAGADRLIAQDRVHQPAD